MTATSGEVAVFKEGDKEACACKVSRGLEAVVAAVDDQRVPFLVLQRTHITVAEAPLPHPSTHSFLYALVVPLIPIFNS
jgi:hypothetical protein